MKGLLLACAFAGMALTANADVMPYTDPAGQGTQAWGGNLALDFDVNSPITVTALGVFNASGSPITGPIQVAIFDTATNTEVTPVETFQGSYAPAGLGFDVFQAIAPVVLEPGSYEVDALGFGPADLNGNLNTGSSSGPILNGGGVLTFTGASWDYNTSFLDDPLTCPTCQPLPVQSSQFDAGTFEFQPGVPSTVPEPSAFLLLLTGLLMTAFWRRFRPSS
jgi:hypothetical protein